MEPSDVTITPPTEEESPQVAKKESYVAIIVLVVLTLAVILVVILYLFFFLRSHKELLTAAPLTNQPDMRQQSFSQDTANEANQDTITASSLDVPLLYSHADWQAVPKDSHDNSLATLIYSVNNIQVILNGKYWTTEIENDTSMSVDTYYINILKKERWVSSSSMSSLQFADFSLTPPVADGPCSGINSFLGYKDGAVRMVSILGEKVPCQSTGSAYTTPATDYTIFVSDPMTISDIEKYVKSKS